MAVASESKITSRIWFQQPRGRGLGRYTAYPLMMVRAVGPLYDQPNTPVDPAQRAALRAELAAAAARIVELSQLLLRADGGWPR